MPTLATIRSRVQIKLNDTDAPKGSLDVIQYDHAIADAAIVLGAQIPEPHLYLPLAFTISAGAETFTLPTAAQTGYVSLTQYAGEIRIRLTNRKHFLVRKSLVQLDALREYWAQPVTGAWPEYFALFEEMDNDMQGRCWPGAATAEPCDLFVVLAPDDLRDAADLDAANVRFGRYGSAALVFHASAILAASLPAEELSKRKINPGVIPLWQKEAARAMYADEMRRGATEASPPGSDHPVAAGVN